MKMFSCSETLPVTRIATAAGTNVIALGNTGGLAKTGSTFTGWNTVANGIGAGYAVGNTFAMGSGNVVLYAPGNVPLWHTHSNGTAASLFIIQSDANVVLYGPAGQVYWHRF